MRKLTEFEKNQLKIGEKIEMEHTKYHKIADKIAMDHINEFKNKPYYTELVKMEKKLKHMKVKKNRR